MPGAREALSLKVPPPCSVSWNLPVHSSRFRGEEDPKAELPPPEARLGEEGLESYLVRVRVRVKGER